MANAGEQHGAGAIPRHRKLGSMMPILYITNAQTGTALCNITLLHMVVMCKGAREA